ncbi:hypothetical protein [Salinispora pacifica]|uniref:hypothetical protein n=1 Tax=Salinispora pacifica TaxID=351187 RepID=UPI0004AE668F|nr:hypothetical protein [Salinispora pacifica]
MSIYAVLIDGWDHRSTWGWDDGTRSLYAQLTRNGNSDDNGPDVWITPPATPRILLPEALAKAIAHVTGTNLATVHAAMNDSLDQEGQHLRLPAVPGRRPVPAPAPEDVRPFEGLGPYQLRLAGWQNSEFGYGIGLHSFWARLRHDEQHTDIWISPQHGGRPMPHINDLGEAIAGRTGHRYAAIRAAINHAVDHQSAPNDFRLP